MGRCDMLVLTQGHTFVSFC